ncbi:MAG: hypothetical protein U0790_05605 [Isosphaeraceae bacterium]
MNGSLYFERLVAAVERIARHAYYPGIDEAIDQSLEDVDDLLSAGRITSEQRDALRFVLLGISMSEASKATAA